MRSYLTSTLAIRAVFYTAFVLLQSAGGEWVGCVAVDNTGGIKGNLNPLPKALSNVDAAKVSQS